ncbi:MAG TPA: DUF4440 domain-containing protein [Thermoanaerobaculia bacterium]|nr:DUF4440 domain-containing protein [Thermoanaerobaculia bacterium]
MKRLLAILAAVLSFGSFAAAEAPAPAAPELTALLNEFLAGVSRGDASVHERFWAEDLIYTSAAGRRIGKADILKESRQAAAGKSSEPAYTSEDVRVHQYGDTAVVAFQLVMTTQKPGGPEVARYLNTGTFARRGGRWQAVGWQATRLDNAKADPSRNDSARSDLLRVDGEWSAAAGSPDLERIVSYWSEDAVVTPPHEAPIAGKPAIRKFVADSMKVPGFSVRWKPSEAVVSSSGDFGYTTGTNVFTFPDPSGKIVTSPGRYVTVWKKDDAGRWRCVVDFWNEAPVSASESKK